MKERILARERINRLLADIFEYPLFIVAAPMGYGKPPSDPPILSTLITKSPAGCVN